jgi:transcriptional regulator NrdR family protein
MKCPECNSKALVMDSRPSGERIRRRYRCTGCEARFSTLELVESDVDALENGVARGKAIESVVGRMNSALRALRD